MDSSKQTEQALMRWQDPQLFLADMIFNEAFNRPVAYSADGVEHSLSNETHRPYTRSRLVMAKRKGGSVSRR